MPPNWKEIDRCPIWKVLGVTECNSCNTLVQCWGEESIPPEPKTKNSLLEQLFGGSRQIGEK